jgi:16S rRNA (guanine527-N7)-methyltransferase
LFSSKRNFMTEWPPAWTPFTAPLGGLDLPGDFFPQVERFLDTLSAINESLNLISFSTRDDLRSHVVDSLQVLRLAGTGTALNVIDVGSGGGFPGIPVALARPHWRVTLLDSLRKKQLAMASLIEELNVPPIFTLCQRAEDLGHEMEHREKFDLALCRAVGRFSPVLELTLPLLRVGGRSLLHRGADGLADGDRSAKALTELGGHLGSTYSYRLPGLDNDRHIICIEKTTQTSFMFPRRAGIPDKRPL